MGPEPAPTEPAGELAELRARLAVGSYCLGRLGLPEASELAGLTSTAFRQLMASAAWPAEAVAGSGHDPAPTLSVVVPVLDEEVNLGLLYDRLAPVLRTLGPYEIVFVDDGSTDGSVDAILARRHEDPSVKLVRLSRNFGHQAALSAGLDHARGQAVVFMDADLQDPPEVLPALVERWQAGHDVAYAVRTRRKEGRLKRLAYFGFYRALRRLAEMDVPVDSGDYCLIDRRVADGIRALPERNRFLRGLRSWVGFSQVGVPYDRPARHAGPVKYSFAKLVRLALDGLVAFSSAPLRLASYLGFLTAGAGVAYILVAVLARAFAGSVPAGWTSTIAIILTVGGAQLIMTGVLGEYLARVYHEVKRRPLYVVSAVHGARRVDE